MVEWEVRHCEKAHEQRRAKYLFYLHCLFSDHFGIIVEGILETKNTGVIKLLASGKLRLSS